MKLSTDIEINDNPPAMFHTEIAAMHGDDGTEGSIGIVSAPFGSTVEGSPHQMGVRASQHVVFEHEGRRGQFDLAELFEEWVIAIGDRPEPPVPEIDQKAELEANIARRKAERREGAGF